MTSALDWVDGQRLAPAAFTSGKDLVPIIQKGGWDPGPVWIDAENLVPHGNSIAGPSARSESLYVLTNKVRELIVVKMLHTSLLNTTEVAFRVFPLGSYAPMPGPSPPLKTILKLVLWNSLQTCSCQQCHQNAFLSIFPLSSEKEKSHWGLDPVNRQGVPTQLFV